MSSGVMVTRISPSVCSYHMLIAEYTNRPVTIYGSPIPSKQKTGFHSRSSEMCCATSFSEWRNTFLRNKSEQGALTPGGQTPGRSGDNNTPEPKSLGIGELCFPMSTGANRFPGVYISMRLCMTCVRVTCVMSKLNHRSVLIMSHMLHA